VASQPPRLAGHDAVAAAASQQPPSDTAEQRVSELLEHLAAQRREFDQSLQLQQAAFQATLREEVDIRVALQTCVHMRNLGSDTKHLRSCDQHR
jgi:ABC-type transporter MlaC component